MTPRTRIPGLFITGTDTGIGKTLVSCGLAAWCRERGLRVGVMKPVCTGGRDDARRLARAAGGPAPLSRINPVVFAEPLAPWVAARRAGRTIRLDQLIGAYRALSAGCDVVIVEGVGGLLVPLTARQTVADLARRLGLPLLVVARAGLGTINHTLLTCRWAARQRLTVRAVLLNHDAPLPQGSRARLAGQTNPSALRELTGLPVLGPLPHLPHASAVSPIQLSEWLACALGTASLTHLLGVEHVDTHRRLC